MATHLLRFESKAKNIGLTAADVPHEAKIANWCVTESLVPHRDEDLREKGMGAYTLSLEREVATQDEVWKGLDEAGKLAEEIDVAWCYAWGQPFRAAHREFVSEESPLGWMGNMREVERNIQREAGGFIVAAMQVVSRSWAYWPCFPLKSALTARNACVGASPIIQELIQLHVRSHKGTDSQLFLLAKALEIIGAFFRGSRANRNNGIQSAMRKIGIDTELTQSAEWLFAIGNERFDVRHAWDPSSPGVVLHPRMTSQERMDFEFNSDLVIRAFVCDQLNINVPIIREGGSPKYGRWNGEVLEFDS